MLNDQEKELRHFYQTVLTLCNKEKAISKGEFFDLMYVNSDGWMMNPHRQYVFMRKCDDELLLIITNFDSIPVNVSVNIPQHAFDFWGMRQYHEIKSRDLLTGKSEKIAFCADKPVVTDVPAYGGKILKIKL